MKTPLLLGLSLVLFFGCAHGGPQKPLGDKVAVVSLVGDQIALDVSANGSWFGTGLVELKVPDWKVDETFVSLFNDAARARGLHPVALVIDQRELAKARKVRESRFKRVNGRHSQAVTDLLLREAGRQGVQQLVLLESLKERDDEPLFHQAAVGLSCADRENRASPVIPFFRIGFSLWDVASSTIIHDFEVTAGIEPPLALSCQSVEDLRGNPASLEAPVKADMKLQVDGWAPMFWGPSPTSPEPPSPLPSPWVQQ